MLTVPTLVVLIILSLSGNYHGAGLPQNKIFGDKIFQFITKQVPASEDFDFDSKKYDSGYGDGDTGYEDMETGESEDNAVSVAFTDLGGSYSGGHGSGHKVKPRKPGPYGKPTPNFKCVKSSETLYVTKVEWTFDKKCFNVFKVKCTESYDEGKVREC